MDYSYIVGQRIRHYRKASGLTQKELADKLGVAPRYIGNIEQGNRRPSLEMLVNICKWFGINTSDVLPVEDERNTEVRDRIISEINDALGALEITQMELVKTMVCSLVG